MWYVYFLRLSNQDIYVGITEDINKRFDQHSKGNVKSTKCYRPLSLCSYIAVPDKQKALELERYFKTGSGKAILKKRIISEKIIK
ncbi:MAG: GIY-YIG nuclease family protein [Planctomycetes bacterium]|nr:GIY-YIG nuclease family protein [Planctomycetota bacterium]